MDSGLTIAFICNKNNHPSYVCYNIFGNKYWDDTQYNNSKIGYYFAYYYRQEFVYLHKIINILKPNERPKIMSWNTDRQILCLSERLKKFTWNEWTTKIGLHAPYTPKYYSTQTSSWSCNKLKEKFESFNFIHFKNIIEPQIEESEQREESEQSEQSEEDEDDRIIREAQERIKLKNKKKYQDIKEQINIITDEIKASFANQIHEAEQQILRIKEQQAQKIKEKTETLNLKLVKYKLTEEA
jgi:hypothetical protein